MTQDKGRKKVAKGVIPFSNGKQAVVVSTPSSVAAGAIIKKLGLEKPEAVILVLGEATIPDEEVHKRLFQLFSRGLVRVAERNGMLIIDRGTENKVTMTLGKALADRSSKTPLLGVASDGHVLLPGPSSSDDISQRKMVESNHSHFVLVKGDQPKVEVSKMYEIAEELSKGVPILTVLINVSPIATDDVLGSVRRGWPILVITGGTNTTSEIKSTWRDRQDYIAKISAWANAKQDMAKPDPPFIPDTALAEVIADGNLTFFSITDTPENLEQHIELRFSAASILDLARAQQERYHLNAERHRKLFQLHQRWILLLGVFITGLAAFQSFYRQMLSYVVFSVGGLKGSLEDMLFTILLIVPVVLAILIAIANRFDDGNKMLTLRAAAEALEREMFRYRTRTGIYSDTKVGENGNRDVLLSSMLETITKQWVEGKLNFGTLYSYTAAPARDLPIWRRILRIFLTRSNTFEQEKPKMSIPDYLPPSRYFTERLSKNLDYFNEYAPKLGMKFAILQQTILIIGGSATLLAAIHAELLITVSTACATALASYLNYNQIANSLKQCNHGILSLTNIQNWWVALGEAQEDQDNIEKLVEYVETTLQSEQAGWIQQMQTVLTELRAQQARQGTAAAVTEPVTTTNTSPSSAITS